MIDELLRNCFNVGASMVAQQASPPSPPASHLCYRHPKWVVASCSGCSASNPALSLWPWKAVVDGQSLGPYIQLRDLGKPLAPALDQLSAAHCSHLRSQPANG